MMSPPLRRFYLKSFRNYDAAELAFEHPVTLICGPNGAGKTSLLEAIHVLAAGRSFRTGRHDKLVRNGDEHALLRAELEVEGRLHRVGMERGRQGLVQLKLDGDKVRGQSAVAQLFPVVALHPDTVALVEAGAEGRRRLFDWLMFHVEHEFLGAWRALSHAVKQRNGLLRQGGFQARELTVWDRQLIVSSDRIDRLRQGRFAAFREAFSRVLATLSEELPEVTLALFSGWDHRQGLEPGLRAREDTDRQRGFTSLGAHRMDLKLGCRDGAVKEVFSRGQKKLVSYALVLAALEVIATELAGHRHCVVLVDDLSSELDEHHGRSVLSLLSALPHQVVITALDPALPQGLDNQREIAMFHVEHGQLQPVETGH